MLPAALVAALAVMAVAQLAITEPVELPPVGPIGVGAPLALLNDPQPRGVPGLIASRPIFAPPATANAGSDDGEAAVIDPLGGAAIVGTVGVGRLRYAVVQLGRATRRVSIGGTISGWRLIGLGDDAALLARGAERLRRPYGAGTGGTENKSGSSADEPASEDQQ